MCIFFICSACLFLFTCVSVCICGTPSVNWAFIKLSSSQLSAELIKHEWRTLQSPGILGKNSSAWGLHLFQKSLFPSREAEYLAAVFSRPGHPPTQRLQAHRCGSVNSSFPPPSPRAACVWQTVDAAHRPGGAPMADVDQSVPV